MLTTILASKLFKPVLIVILIFTAVGYIYIKGGNDRQDKIELEQSKDVIKTRKEIDEAIINSPNTPDGAREWLLNRQRTIN